MQLTQQLPDVIEVAFANRSPPAFVDGEDDFSSIRGKL